ncbi:MAG: hypothetical protein RL308_1731 [Bacteroidota bacterium]|jgi:hypothetical protein
MSKVANSDATPSWSGFIFQGEVGLCKAIEKINALDNLPNSYVLKIEEDEDFSIHTDDIEVFQVKALAKDTIGSYRDTIEGLIDIYSPTKSTLISWKEIRNLDIEDFDDEYFNAFGVSFFIEGGKYTPNNVGDKLKDEIRMLLTAEGVGFNDYDIQLKHDHICQIICRKIKERHVTKTVESFPLIDIKDWIINGAPEAYNDEIAWFHIRRIFFNAMLDDLDSFARTDGQEDKHDRLLYCATMLENLSDGDFKKLIEDYVVCHKRSNGKLTLMKFGDFISSQEIQDVICKCLANTETDPNFKELRYNFNSEVYQLTTINKNINTADPKHEVQIQKELEHLRTSPKIDEVQHFINHFIELPKERIIQLLTKPEPTNDFDKDEKEVSIEPSWPFSMIKVDDAIQKIK